MYADAVVERDEHATEWLSQEMLVREAGNIDHATCPSRECRVRPRRRWPRPRERAKHVT